MELKTYLETIESAAKLAVKLKVAPELISQWKTGRRPIPIERCFAIELETNSLVSRRDLRPNDWKKIWPELEQQEAA
jgi:DNA-binding transcriptional regulator YdaS (Cro superfamily)